MAYELSCVQCSFETTLDRTTDLDELYDVIESHQSDRTADHFVNFVATHVATRTADAAPPSRRESK